MAERISASSITAEEASQPWVRSWSTSVAANASPARLVSRGGRSARKGRQPDQARISRGSGEPDEASRRAVGHDQDRDPPGDLLSILESLPLQAIAAENVDCVCECRQGSLPIPHVPHRGSEHPETSSRGGENARCQSVRQRRHHAHIAGLSSEPSKASSVQGRVAATEADGELVAMRSAGHQQCPVGRMVGYPDRLVVDPLPCHKSLISRLVGSSSRPRAEWSVPFNAAAKPAPMPPRSSAQLNPWTNRRPAAPE